MSPTKNPAGSRLSSRKSHAVAGKNSVEEVGKTTKEPVGTYHLFARPNLEPGAMICQKNFHQEDRRCLGSYYAGAWVRIFAGWLSNDLNSHFLMVLTTGDICNSAQRL